MSAAVVPAVAVMVVVMAAAAIAAPEVAAAAEENKYENDYPDTSTVITKHSNISFQNIKIIMFSEIFFRGLKAPERKP